MAGTVTKRPKDETRVFKTDIGDSLLLDGATTRSIAPEDLVRSLMGSFPPCGRLTLSPGLAVPGASVAGSSNVYYTPYAGNLIPLYDGASMSGAQFDELTNFVGDATKSPAAVQPNRVYDMFVWHDGSRPVLSRGPAWTDPNTRGYSQTSINGILLNTSAIANGPAALRGTYVGTIASNAAGTIDFIFGSPASGGGAAVLNVWNAYNRIPVGTEVIDSGPSYTYQTATIRQARGSAGNQISFVVGLMQDALLANYATFCGAPSVGTIIRVGIGYDTTTAGLPKFDFKIAAFGDGENICMNSPPLIVTPTIGTHYIAGCEQGDGSNLTAYDVFSGRLGLSILLPM